MDARGAGLFDWDSGVRFGGAVAQSHDEVMRAWEVRHEARQRIIAREVAAKRDDVRAFRETNLPDGLLAPDADVIGEWLDARAREAIAQATSSQARDGESASSASTRRLKVDVGPAPTSEQIRRRDQGGNWEREARDYYGKYTVFGRDVPLYLAAGDLIRLGDTLRDEFGWTVESATRWVIVRDAVPSTGSILDLRDLHQTRGQDENGVPWHTWAELRVPLTFPASRLAREFDAVLKIARNMMRDPIAPRPTAPENVALVLFCVDRNDGTRTWMEVLKLWNQEHADSRFEETRKGVHLFAKTVRKTYRAIMGEQLPLVWRTTDADAD